MNVKTPSSSFLALLFATGLLAVFALACPSQTEAPGDVLLGDFDFQAAPAGDGCPFDLDFPERFTGTLSLDSRTGEAYLTASGFVHQGTFEDRWIKVGATARRTLPADCTASPGDWLSVEETIEARLYPEDEARAVSGCPWPIERPDAGSASWNPNLLQDGGVDVRLVCGTVRNRLVAMLPDGGTNTGTQPVSCSDAGIEFQTCDSLFTLSGRRH